MEKIGWTRENFKSILNKYSYILSLNREETILISTSIDNKGVNRILVLAMGMLGMMTSGIGYA